MNTILHYLTTITDKYYAKYKNKLSIAIHYNYKQIISFWEHTGGFGGIVPFPEK